MNTTLSLTEPAASCTDIDITDVANQDITPPYTPEKATYASSTPMTPNTRKRKSRLAEDISDLICDLTTEEQMDVLTLATKQLGIYESYKFQRKPTKAGRKQLPIETRKTVWDFWHCNEFIIESTLTSRQAKLRVSNRSKIQDGLNFYSPASTIIQQSREFYEAPWSIFQNTLKELYCIYVTRNPDQHVSWGTFNAIKPFYVCTATSKDI